MSLMNKSECEGSLIPIIICGLVFNGAVLRVFYHIARDVGQSSAQRVDDDDVVCKCFFKRCSAWLLTMYCSLTAVACYLVASIFALISHILYFSVCDKCVVRNAFWNIKNAFIVMGYTMLFVSYFQRLRLSSNGSAMELPKWAPKVMYAVLPLFVVLFVSVGVFRYTQPNVASLCTALTILLYFAVVCVLIRAFLKKTLAAANTSPPDAVLLEVATRISIVVTVSLLSTTLNFVLWAIILGTCPMCYFWTALGNAVMECVQCLNAFCLMCTFSSAADAYMLVFGGMHAAFVAHLKTALPRMEAQIRMHSVTDTDSDDQSHADDIVSDESNEALVSF